MKALTYTPSIAKYVADARRTSRARARSRSRRSARRARPAPTGCPSARA